MTKRRRSDPVLWQKPLHQQKCKKGKVTTQTTPQKSSIKQRLRTDLGQSVGVTTATQLVWLTWFTGPWYGICFPFKNDDVYFYCWYILFDICKERYMDALILWGFVKQFLEILWGFVKQFIEIDVNKVSRILNEWSGLHVEKIKKQFKRAKRAENLKKNAILHKV